MLCRDGGQARSRRCPVWRVKSLVKRIIVPGATVLTDGLACFRGIVDAGCNHVPISPRAQDARPHAMRPSSGSTPCSAISKTAVTGTYRALRKKHMVRYLAEFEWRFNHRFDLDAMIDDLGRAAVRNQVSFKR